MSGPAAATLLQTAGSLVAVRAEVASLSATVLAATGASIVEGMPNTARSPDITLRLDRNRRRFDTSGMRLVTRGVWVDDRGETVVESVGGSGFSQRWSADGEGLVVDTRWTPSPAETGAARVLRSRFDALRAQVLLHYPVLWWAGVKGLAPLHVSVLEVDGVAVLLAGPGGLGKSTLVARELGTGASATCDNLAVSDGIVTHGLREPLRLPASVARQRGGTRTTHGRRVQPWPGRVPMLRPDLVVVVRRGAEPEPSVRRIDPVTAQRAIVAGTFAAGELRRFWPLTAMLALATGHGPALPHVEAIAESLTSRLPCFELALGAQPGAPLRVQLSQQLTDIRREGALP